MSTDADTVREALADAQSPWLLPGYRDRHDAALAALDRLAAAEARAETLTEAAE